MEANQHYVNNKKLFDVLVVWLAEVEKAKLENSEKPRMPEYIGECIMLMATRLSNKPNFFHYTYKSEMVSSACLVCVRNLEQFNPTRSSNPFSWLTSVICNEFLKVLHRESKETYIKLALTAKGEDEKPSGKRRNEVQVRNAEAMAAFESRQAAKKQRNRRGEEKRQSEKTATIASE